MNDNKKNYPTRMTVTVPDLIVSSVSVVRICLVEQDQKFHRSDSGRGCVLIQLGIVPGPSLFANKAIFIAGHQFLKKYL